MFNLGNLNFVHNYSENRYSSGQNDVHVKMTRHKWHR